MSNGNIINKLDLVKEISDALDLPQATVKKVTDYLWDFIKTKLSKDDSTVSVAGFGNFSVKHRAARAGRNPKTGESIQIKATKAVAFKPAKLLKESVNSSK